MNIEEYISSGLIEAYVLGIATPEETQEIERLAELYPEMRDAVLEEKALLETYTLSQSLVPPAALKSKIWEAIQAEEKIRENKVPDKPVSTENPILKPKSRRSYALAASIALLILSGLANVRLMRGNKKIKEELESALNEQKKMRTEKDQVQVIASQTEEVLKVMSLPNLKKIKLDGVGSNADQSCMLYWDAANGNVYLDLKSMPAAPEGKQYQLWAIVDGKPVDAGIYEKQMLSMAQMKTIARAEMFAITIEKAGGSPVPTLDQMVVAGKTS